MRRVGMGLLLLSTLAVVLAAAGCCGPVEKQLADCKSEVAALQKAKTDCETKVAALEKKGGKVSGPSGPIIILEPTPNDLGNHWKIDGASAISTNMGGNEHNEYAIGVDVLEFKAKFGSDEEIDIRKIKVNFKKDGTTYTLEIRKSSLGPMLWKVNGDYLAPRAVSPPAQWPKELCGTLDAQVRAIRSSSASDLWEDVTQVKIVTQMP